MRSSDLAASADVEELAGEVRRDPDVAVRVEAQPVGMRTIGNGEALSPSCTFGRLKES